MSEVNCILWHKQHPLQLSIHCLLHKKLIGDGTSSKSNCNTLCYGLNVCIPSKFLWGNHTVTGFQAGRIGKEKKS